MLRPWVAAALAGLVAVGMVVSAIAAWMPPPPSDYAIHSYSGRTIGYRGLYETLQETGVDVSRSWETPDNLFRGRRRVLLLQPDLYLLEREKAYLAQMEAWIRGGGQLVLSTRDLSFLEGNPSIEDEEDRESAARALGPDELARRLGVESLTVEPPLDDEPGGALRRVPQGPVFVVAQPELDAEPVFTGTLAGLAGSAAILRVPDEALRWFEGDDLERAAGTVEVEVYEDEPYPVVLEVALGAGTVTLVSEPTLLNNIGLGEADNAVVAHRLAAGAGDRPVVFDEYYHGALTGLGPTALLALRPYGVIAVFVLVATLLWAWSNAVRFGPPVPAPAESRRSILEYVDAMARLFRRGRKRAFVLRTNRNGLVEEIRREFSLPHGTPQERVLRRIAQSDPDRARRLEEILREVDAALAREKPLSDSQLATLQERLETCRTWKALKPAPKPSARPMAS